MCTGRSICLLIALLAIIAWLHSLRFDDTAIVRWGEERLSLHSLRGRLYIERNREPPTRQLGFRSESPAGVTYVAESGGHQLLGFAFGSLTDDYHFVAFPWWFVTAMPLTAWMLLRPRSRESLPRPFPIIARLRPA